MLKRSFTETADKFAFGAKKPKTENPSNEFRKAVPSDEYSKLKKRGKIGNFVSYPQKENNQHSGGEKVYEKLTRKQKKKLREKRRAFYDEATDIKKTWEFLRAETSKEKKEVLSQRIFDQLDSEEKLIQLCASHDTCRVLEWAFKFAKEETREKIFQIIKRNFVSLAQNRYGNHMILTVVKVCSKTERAEIMKLVRGKTKELFLHSFANEVVEELYNNYADETERVLMQCDVYSKYFYLKVIDQIEDSSKADIKPDLSQMKSLQALLDNNSNLKQSVLANVKRFLLKCVNTKSMRHSFAHKILLEFFTVMKKEEKDSVIAEIAPLLSEWLLQMAHTPDGSKAVVYSLWYSNAKDRKGILKTFKEHVVSLCQHENGHMVILAIMDCVDDTRIINECIIKPMSKMINTLISDKWGYKCLVYILSPRTKGLFNVETCNFLSMGEDNMFSKKDAGTRYETCCQFLAPSVATVIQSSLTEDNMCIANHKNMYHVCMALTTSKYLKDASIISELLDTLAGACIHNEHFLESFLPYTLIKNILVTSQTGNTSESSIQDDQISTSCKFTHLFERRLDGLEELRFLLSWMLSKRKCNVLVALTNVNLSETFKDRLQRLVDSCTKKRKAKILESEHVSELKKLINFE